MVVAGTLFMVVNIFLQLNHIHLLLQVIREAA